MNDYGSTEFPKGLKPVLDWLGICLWLLIRIFFFYIVSIIFLTPLVLGPDFAETYEGPPLRFVVLSLLTVSIIVPWLSLRFLQGEKGRLLELNAQWPPRKNERWLGGGLALFLIAVGSISYVLISSLSSQELTSAITQVLGGSGIELFTGFSQLSVTWKILAGVSSFFGFAIVEPLLFQVILQQGLEQRSSKSISITLAALVYLLVVRHGLFSVIFFVSRAIIFAQNRNFLLAVMLAIIEWVTVSAIYVSMATSVAGTG